MKTINDGNPLPRHLDADDLIAFLDGEVSRAEQDCTRTHLEGCWNCRSRLLAVQNSIESFLRLRKQILPPDNPPSGATMAQFRRRLSQHASAPVTLRSHLHWLRSLMPASFGRGAVVTRSQREREKDKSGLSSWNRLFPGSDLIWNYKKTALATGLAVLVLLALLIDPLGFNHVSAGELLARADSYEFLK